MSKNLISQNYITNFTEKGKKAPELKFNTFRQYAQGGGASNINTNQQQPQILNINPNSKIANNLINSINPTNTQQTTNNNNQIKLRTARCSPKRDIINVNSGINKVYIEKVTLMDPADPTKQNLPENTESIKLKPRETSSGAIKNFEANFNNYESITHNNNNNNKNTTSNSGNSGVILNNISTQINSLNNNNNNASNSNLHGNSKGFIAFKPINTSETNINPKNPNVNINCLQSIQVPLNSQIKGGLNFNQKKKEQILIQKQFLNNSTGISKNDFYEDLKVIQQNIAKKNANLVSKNENTGGVNNTSNINIQQQQQPQQPQQALKNQPAVRINTQTSQQPQQKTLTVKNNNTHITVLTNLVSNNPNRAVPKKDKSMPNNVNAEMYKKFLGGNEKNKMNTNNNTNKNTISSLGNAKPNSAKKKTLSNQSGKSTVKPSSVNQNTGKQNAPISVSVGSSQQSKIMKNSIVICSSVSTNANNSKNIINNKFVSNNNEYSKQQSKPKNYSSNNNTRVESAPNEVICKPIIKDNSTNADQDFKSNRPININNNYNNIYIHINNPKDINNNTNKAPQNVNVIVNNLDIGQQKKNTIPNSNYNTNNKQISITKQSHSRKSSGDNTININQVVNQNLKNSVVKQTEESQADTERLYDNSQGKNLNNNFQHGSTKQIQSNNNQHNNINSNYSTKPESNSNNYIVKLNLKQTNIASNIAKPGVIGNSFKQILQNSKIPMPQKSQIVYINSNSNQATGSGVLNTQPNSNYGNNQLNKIKTTEETKSLVTEPSSSITKKPISVANNYCNINLQSNTNTKKPQPILIQTLISSNSPVLNSNLIHQIKKPQSSLGPQCIEINYNSQFNKNNQIISTNSSLIRPASKVSEKADYSKNIMIKSPEVFSAKKVPQTEKITPKSSSKNITIPIKQQISKISAYMSNYESVNVIKKNNSKYNTNSSNNNSSYNANYAYNNNINKVSTYVTNSNNINSSSQNRKSSENENHSGVLSIHEGDFNSFKKEADGLTDYIKTYFLKHKEYPPTTLKFYKFGRLLGRGAFGKVNLGLHILTGRLVAIKSFNKSILNNEKSKKKILYEVNLMRKLRQNSVVKIFETFETTKYLIIIMEYVSGGDLLSYVKKRTKLSEPVAKYLFRQIVLALEYTHSQNIVHRDIKLDNILLDVHNNIKICDFGVGKQIKNKKEIMYDQCGTPAYIAPEILKGSGYEGPQVDYWSAGVVLYAMLSGTVPFKANDMSELHKIITKGDFQEIEGISSEVNSLLHGILEVDYKKRYGADEILSQIWMYEADENGTNFKMELFANAEKMLLAKSDIDYRKADKENILENFTLKNLETKNDLLNKNVATRSNILAPFNSSLKDSKEEKYLYKLTVDNNIMKLVGKVKEANHFYELNNNLDIDNGVIKKQSSKEINKVKEKDGVKSGMVTPGDFLSNPISPPVEFINRVSSVSTPRSESVTQRNTKGTNQSLATSTFVIDEQCIKLVEQVGYNREYLLNCLNYNELNHATTCYYIFSLTKQ